MKRFIGLVALLFCIIGMTAGTAMATIEINDQISIKGQMRFRFWDKTNQDYNDVETHQQQYWDQRYRLWFDVKPQEGMSAHLRFDLDDAMWGADSYGSSRWNASGEGHDDTIEVGRAYLVLEQPQFKVVGGLNYWELGNRLTYENTGTGFTIETTTLPARVRFGYILEDELGSKDDTEGDQSNFFIEVDSAKLVKGHLFKAFFAKANDEDKNFQAQVFGVSAKGKLFDKKLSYKAELDILDGDEDAGDEIFGQQFWLNVDYKVTKKFTVGGNFIYAKGADKAGEDQYDSIMDARSDNWDIQTYGPYTTMYAPLGMADVLDPEGQNTGAIAGSLFGKYRLFEKLDVYASYLYVEAESNALATQTFQDAMVATVSARYYFSKKTQFAVMYGHSTMDVEGSTIHDDAEKTMSAFLRISF
jgi:predicted porin